MSHKLRYKKKTMMPADDRMMTMFRWLAEIAVICLVAYLLVKYYGYQVSNIGDSMNPVLENGDIVLVDRIVYDARAPKRGDVIVFKPEGNEHTHHYVKRVVGLPGETIQIIDGKILIDGKELKEKYETTALADPGIAEEEILLGENEFFVLGDNRMSSQDSRNLEIGNIKRSEIKGKAWVIISPFKNIGRVK